MCSTLTIETSRLLLRPWRDEDIESWVAMNADPRVMEYFVNPYDRAQSESSASTMRTSLERDGYGFWVVEVKDSISFAGVIALVDVPFEAHFTPAREIGWRLIYDAWGEGYATEGAKAALDFAFTTLRWEEIVSMTSVLNLRSRRVMERIGMTHDPLDDFDHPRIPDGHRLKRHVLYRLKRIIK